MSTSSSYELQASASSPARLASNDSTFDLNLFREAFLVTFSFKRQQLLSRVGMIITVCGILLLAIQILFHKVLILGLPLILVGIAIILWARKLPEMECKKSYRKFAMNRSSSTVKRQIDFFDTYMNVYFYDGDPIEIPYKEVETVRETEHLMLLTCQGKRGVIFRKDGFTEGDCELIRTLLPTS